MGDSGSPSPLCLDPQWLHFCLGGSLLASEILLASDPAPPDFRMTPLLSLADSMFWASFTISSNVRSFSSVFPRIFSCISASRRLLISWKASIFFVKSTFSSHPALQVSQCPGQTTLKSHSRAFPEILALSDETFSPSVCVTARNSITLTTLLCFFTASFLIALSNSTSVDTTLYPRSCICLCSDSLGQFHSWKTSSSPTRPAAAT